MTRTLMLLAALLAGGTVIVAARGCPRCLRGHDEVRHVPAQTVSEEITSFEVEGVHLPIYGDVYHPAHDVTVWVCDQYEVEKETR